MYTQVINQHRNMSKYIIIGLFRVPAGPCKLGIRQQLRVWSGVLLHDRGLTPCLHNFVMNIINEDMNIITNFTPVLLWFVFTVSPITVVALAKPRLTMKVEYTLYIVSP